MIDVIVHVMFVNVSIVWCCWLVNVLVVAVAIIHYTQAGRVQGFISSSYSTNVACIDGECVERIICSMIWTE